MNRNTKRIIKKYTKKICIAAYNLNEKGNGAQTIGYDLNVSTNTADALINAGQEIAEAVLNVSKFNSYQGRKPSEFSEGAQIDTDEGQKVVKWFNAGTNFDSVHFTDGTHIMIN